jgi:hypothetical protein
MPRTPARTPVLPLLITLTLAAAAPAQDQPAPGRPEAPPIRPTRPGQDAPKPASIPGLESTDRRIKAPALLREGSFVVRRRGNMVKLPSGEYAFVFHKDAKGVAERPMVLIPNQTLQRMELSVGDQPSESVYSVSGEVFAYRNVNYLLLSAAAMESTPPPAPANAGAPAEEVPAKNGDAAPGEPAPAGSEEVQDLIRRLEMQRERPRTLDPAMQAARPETAPAPAAATGAPSQIIPEGRTIVRRRGRMVRAASGDWSFVFDAGTDGEASQDRPLMLAPCLALQGMEQSAMRDGDAATIEVSGRILAYNGKNYLIPTLYQVVRAGDIQPRP